MIDRDVQADDRSVAPADERRPLDLQEVHHAEHVGGHQVVPEGLLVARASPVAAAVHDDDLIALRQRRHLVAPVVGVPEPAVEQDHRFAVTEDGVPDLDAVHRRIPAARGLGQRRRGGQGQPSWLGVRRHAGCENRYEARDRANRFMGFISASCPPLRRADVRPSSRRDGPAACRKVDEPSTSGTACAGSGFRRSVPSGSSPPTTPTGLVSVRDSRPPPA